MSQQPDKELDELMDSIAVDDGFYEDAEFTIINPIAKQRLLAWRDKALQNHVVEWITGQNGEKVYNQAYVDKAVREARIDELKNTIYPTPSGVRRKWYEKRLAQLKGGSDG